MTRFLSVMLRRRKERVKGKAEERWNRMTDKEIRRLKRSEILELMIEQSDEIEELKKKLKEAEDKLAKRTVILEKAGSIAEAALALNHIFEDAQKAADQYLENVKRIQTDQQEGQSADREGKNGTDE